MKPPWLHDPERGRKPEPGAFAHLLVVKKGSKILSMTVAGIPVPESRT
jgi:hypothetical protein